jgi:CBS-domain-containing membrane protein
MSATNIPSPCRITNIDPNDVMILPHDANPCRIVFSERTARDVITPGIHCCREDDDLAKAVRHMEMLEVRRLPVINKSKRMVGMLALDDVSDLAPSDLLSEYVKRVSAHH